MSFELDGRHVVERHVDSSVVEPTDVVERRSLDVLHVTPRSLAVDQLGLVEAVKRFDERTIEAVASRADRGHDLGFAEAFLVANAEVLRSRIGTRMVSRPIEVQGGSVQYENILTGTSPRRNS